MNKHLVEALNLLQSNRFLEAAEQCRKALRKPADFAAAKKLLADCYNNQGVIHLFHSGLLKDAEEHFRLALAENPDHLLALKNIAGLLVEQGRLEESIPFFQRVIKLDPCQVDSLRDLAVTYQKLDRLEEAAEVLQVLAERFPADGSALLRNALLVKSIMPDRQYPDQVRLRIANGLAALADSRRTIADPSWFPGTHFYLSYHGLDNKALHQAIAAAHLAVAPSLAWEAPQLAKRDLNGRIRIGIASRFFHNHSIGHTSRGLVEKLDRSRFEVVLIRLGPSPLDDMAKAINAAADQVVEIPLTDLQQARQSIAGLKVDILFWQDIGMEPFSYLLAYARLAPVQLTSFGHPDTTGIPNMDYFLSSALYETASSGDYYSEQLITLPNQGTLAYYYRPHMPDSFHRGDFGLMDEDHVYLCPQTLFKLHPDMDDIFLEIVRRDPSARIVLIEPPQRHMRNQIEKRLGRLSEDLLVKVRFIGRMDHTQYLRLICCADVLLDTLHFNGQNTSLEGFAMGVPIVTLPGELHRSRHTYGMYRAMEIMDLVAESVEDYVAKAVAVASDPAFRSRVSSRIAAAAPVLYENQQFITECERVFESLAQGVFPEGELAAEVVA